MSLKESQNSNAQEEIICKCFQVSEETIRSSISSGDLDSIESVTQACQAGGGCHSCHILIQFYIDQHQASKKAASQASKEKKKSGFWSKIFQKSETSA